MNKNEISQESSTNTPAEGLDTDMSNIKHAQSDMRAGYLNGSSGVIVSGAVWFIAGVVALYFSHMQAVWTLLVGGAFIYPISILLNKALGACGSHAPNIL